MPHNGPASSGLSGLRRKVPLKLQLLLILPVLALWLAGMIGSTAAGPCLQQGPAEKRAKACSLAISAGFLANLSKADAPEMGRLYLERGIARLELGDRAAAEQDFSAALTKAQMGRSAPDWLILRLKDETEALDMIRPALCAAERASYPDLCSS